MRISEFWKNLISGDILTRKNPSDILYLLLLSVTEKKISNFKKLNDKSLMIGTLFLIIGSIVLRNTLSKSE